MPALLGLLAVCVARTANAGGRTWATPEGGRCVAAQVAGAAGLDMRQCWTPTREGYLGRVSKALILQAVREGAGANAAKSIASAKKEVMAREAAALLDGTGWLLPALRVPGATYPLDSGDAAIMPPVAIAAE